MKQKIFKLVFLFLTIGVLTSSKESLDINKAGRSSGNDHACLRTANGCDNMACAQNTHVKEKTCNGNTTAIIDNEVSLSPISRFILLQ